MNKRQQDILASAQRNGKVLVDELALALNLTPQTIWKDLNALCRNGCLRRIHGSATLATAIDNVRYVERRILAREAKIAIGREVAARGPDRASLFINIGTTPEVVAPGTLRPQRPADHHQQPEHCGDPVDLPQ